MKKTISIIGPIGNFTYKGKEISGVQLADVIAAVSSTPNLKELTVEYDTPGGSVSVGKAIFSYLKSIQPRITVISKQIGDIGSIGTVAWFSGSKRIAAKGINPETKKPFQFMAHNPWTPHTEGNADEVQREVDALRITESEMTDFYAEQTGITKEGVAPLMKAEYSFPAERAVELKFATETYEAQNIAAYKPTQNQMTPKDKEKETLVDALLALIKGKKETPIAIAPPAALMGTPVMVNGVAAPDGLYTVVGGVVTALAEVPATAGADNPDNAGTADPAAAAASTKKLDEMIALMKEQPKAEVLIAAVNKLVDEKITGLKKQISGGGGHVPEGFNPNTAVADAKEWDRSFRANEHKAMKRDNPEKYKALYYAKYGKVPNL